MAAVAVLQLATGGTVVLLDERAPARPQAVIQARAVPPDEATGLTAGPLARAAAVERLLADRAAAVLARDRTAFLASVDPRSTALMARQADVFAALEQVPLGSWDYVLDARVQRPPDVRLDERYGAGRWWAPDVALRYALEGFDTRPTVVAHALTFVQRDGRWLLAADDDFAAVGRPTPDALWDRGPVAAVREAGTLVLGHPASSALLREVARQTAAAIPRVTAVWGPGWQREVVVIVPRDAAEMAGLLGDRTDLSKIAAVATAELDDGEYDPAGDRVVLNPEAYGSLSRLGRQVVLTHEVTHVATRRATGPSVPAWLAEGLADTIAYRDAGVPLAVSARELRADVRAGRLPSSLPADEDFAGSNPKLSQAYEQAWLAVRLLGDTYGDADLLAFYRAVGAARDVDAGQAVQTALADQLGTTPEAFVGDWRAWLRSRLG